MARAIRRRARRTNPGRRKSRRRGGFTLPLAIVAGFAPLGIHVVEGFQVGGPVMGLKYATADLTGYNPVSGEWEWGYMKKYGWGPIFAGLIAHKVASWLGVNRALGRARVPWLRV